MEIPSTGSHILASVTEKVLFITLNRPEKLNAVSFEMERDLCRLLDWFEAERSLWVLLLTEPDYRVFSDVTGSGRYFCAGSDLAELGFQYASSSTSGGGYVERVLANPHGFASLARRTSLKPWIVALNGPALGGGAEIIFNCDVVIGCEGAEVSFPEVRRGLVASAGGIPNALLRSPLFSPYLLTGIPIPPLVLKKHLFTSIEPHPLVLPTAQQWAQNLCAGTPDAVQATKYQMNLWKQGFGVEGSVKEILWRNAGVLAGANALDGMRALG